MKYILNPWYLLFYPEKVPIKVFSILFEILWSYCGPGLGISLDLKSADQVTPNQTWIFWSMKYFLYLVFSREMWALLVLDNWMAVTNFFYKGGDTSFAPLRRHCLLLFAIHRACLLIFYKVSYLLEPAHLLDTRLLFSSTLGKTEKLWAFLIAYSNYHTCRNMS